MGSLKTLNQSWILLTALRENLFCAPLLTSSTLNVLSLWMGEGNGNALRYSCLEYPMDEVPGRLQSLMSRRVGCDWATSLSLFTFVHWRRKWQPTTLFLPAESQPWWAAVYEVAQCRTRLRRLSSSSSSSSLWMVFPVCFLFIIFSYLFGCTRS